MSTTPGSTKLHQKARGLIEALSVVVTIGTLLVVSNLFLDRMMQILPPDDTLMVWFTPDDTHGKQCKDMGKETRRLGVRHWNCL